MVTALVESPSHEIILSVDNSKAGLGDMVIGISILGVVQPPPPICQL